MSTLLGMSQQIIDDTIMSGIEAQQALFETKGDPIVLGRIGSLEVRLANSRDAIEAAQELRFRVFFEEMGARKETIEEVELRDADRFDAICDHLLVYDTALPVPEHKQIVGTYRLMRSEQAEKALGFYSADEYDVQRLALSRPDLKLLELGRSCVKAEYRSKRTVELLWQGAWAYCRRHSIDVMFGCASFHGAVPAAHALGLSFLNQNCRATPDWDVRALPHRYQPMDLMPKEAINTKVALFSMPPLVKGYLRLGAMIGDGAVIDEAFGTTDVFIILPIERISSRYITYYGADANRFV
ncbi:GNAT family N-acetyltransferase [Ochrobactrum sp. Marseille-Q0166]|uniref:GNAT family N-acetyltransferase n=1 Tax=Ochrobactrum sp. Marseille-Q0166 TaxID=2761105 RepID=UPI00165527E8|nr:GNAT family N-acetyltransferase [Ochrobactrum sp. Marseille-Q0166]MBC8716094.1 GNAT family N-acetyltransferase [Ochrobactrum sp. Marseille-Q0166]